MRILVTLLLTALIIGTGIGAVPENVQAAPASEEETLGDNPIRILQKRPFLRRERFEVAPAFGLTLNDSMMLHYMVGADVNYHINEYLSAGLSIHRSFGSETRLYEQVQNDYLLIPEATKVDYLATAQGNLALLYGKFALFNAWTVQYDTSVTVGLGLVGLRGELGLTGNWGLGQRFYLTRWLTLNLGLKHYMFMDKSFTHELALSGGLGVFFPFGFEYGSN